MQTNNMMEQKYHYSTIYQPFMIYIKHSGYLF